MRFGKTAYGDESILRAVGRGRYLLAATVYADEERARAALERAKPAGARKLHWYDLDPRRRAASLEAVARIPQHTTIVSAAPLEGKKTERARRKALESLIRALAEIDVDALVLESRGAKEDKRDIDLLMGMRQRKDVRVFRIDHYSGKEEPLLWVPDQILGAYGEVALSGSGRLWRDMWEELEEGLEILEVSAR